MSSDYQAVCDKCQVWCYFGKVSSQAWIGFGRSERYLSGTSNEFIVDLEKNPRNAVDFVFQHVACSPGGVRVTDLNRTDADERTWDLHYKCVRLSWEDVEEGENFLWTDLYKMKFTDWGERITESEPP